MTQTMHEALNDRPARNGVASRILMPEFWGAFAIATMWLAVLFDGIYGADLVSTDASGAVTRIPSVLFVAFFAALATWAVAKRAFGRSSRPE